MEDREEEKSIRKKANKLKEPVLACMNCGHSDLEWYGKTSEGGKYVYLGIPVMGFYKCNFCGYNGVPLEFSDKKGLKKYMKIRENEIKSGKDIRAAVTGEKEQERLEKFWIMLIKFLGIMILLSFVLIVIDILLSD